MTDNLVIFEDENLKPDLSRTNWKIVGRDMLTVCLCILGVALFTIMPLPLFKIIIVNSISDWLVQVMVAALMVASISSFLAFTGSLAIHFSATRLFGGVATLQHFTNQASMVFIVIAITFFLYFLFQPQVYVSNYLPTPFATYMLAILSGSSLILCMLYIASVANLVKQVYSVKTLQGLVILGVASITVGAMIAIFQRLLL